MALSWITSMANDKERIQFLFGLHEEYLSESNR